MNIHRTRVPLAGRIALLLLCAWAIGGGPGATLASWCPSTAVQADDAQKLWVYVGTYTGKSKGIYFSELDMSSGELSAPVLAATTTSPSFLALHPNHRFLYAVNEVDRFAGMKSGSVSAFSIDPQTGALTLLNQQPSRGGGPAHLTVDRQGKNVLVANYGGGSVAVLPIGQDGRLGPATGFVQHTGSSINRSRQEAPHAHSVVLDSANRFAFVADLGLDKVLIYQYDAAQGMLAPNDPPFASVPPGSGPRHFAFHPSGRTAYVINELASTVTAFRYDASKGSLEPLQTISTLPADFTKTNSTAEIAVHPSGKFLYGSNRGHNSIAIFSIDPDTGMLTLIGHEPTQGKTPRNFAIDPTGAYLLAANQDSGTIVVFRIDPESGHLTAAGHTAAISMPVCVEMMPPLTTPAP
jgi:6-phosphogluconolactonase